MPIDPYAALNAMVRAEVARSSEPLAPDSLRERHEPQQSDAGGEGGESRAENPEIADRH